MIFNNYITASFTKIALFSAFSQILSCQVAALSNKNEVAKNQNTKYISKTENLITNCPPEGTCTIRFNKNKGLALKTVNNYLAYNIIADNSKTLVEFQYNSKQEDVAIDGGYREIVIFEIANSVNKLQLKDIDLQQCKMIYAQYSNVRGKAGLFKITSGELLLTKNENEIDFSLKFALDKNAPLINAIHVVKNNLK